MGNKESRRGAPNNGQEVPRELIKYPNGDIFEGHVSKEPKQQGIRHGYGRFVSKDRLNQYAYEYDGEWHDNKRHGRGRCYYYNGNLYQGDWVQGRREGDGQLFMVNRERYDGEWKKDKREGKGILWCSINQTRYEGEFEAGLKHGPGYMYLASGAVFEEKWKRGENLDRKQLKGPDREESMAMVFTNINQSQALLPSPRSIKPLHNQVAQSLKKRALDQLSSQHLAQSTSLEKFDTYNKVTKLLLKSANVQEWTVTDVVEWLKAHQKLEKYTQQFASHDIDGFALLNLAESEIVEDLKVSEEHHVKELQQAIKKLVALWVRFGRNSDVFFRDQEDSHFFDEYISMSESQLQQDSSIMSMQNPSQASQLFIPSEIQEYMVDDPAQDMFASMLSGFKFMVPRDELQIEKTVKEKQASRSLSHSYLSTSNQEIGQSSSEVQNQTPDHEKALLRHQRQGEKHAKWLGLEVLVKKFDRRLLDSSEVAVEQFLKEVEIVHSLRHPNIALFMGLSIDQGKSHAYTVQEFVKGGTLFQYLHPEITEQRGDGPPEVVESSRPLSEQQVFHFAKQIANAFCYLHKMGVHHGNLSSENILITEDWTLKITNFGMAQRLVPKQLLIENDSFSNQSQKVPPPITDKLQWTAPELVRADPNSASPASDVYSFGVILWEMLTGQIPFHRRSPTQIVAMVGYLKDKLRAPPQIDKNLRQIINNCLLFDPERRPPFIDISNQLTKIGTRMPQAHYAAKDLFNGEQKEYVS